MVRGTEGRLFLNPVKGRATNSDGGFHIGIGGPCKLSRPGEGKFTFVEKIVSNNGREHKGKAGGTCYSLDVPEKERRILLLHNDAGEQRGGSPAKGGKKSRPPRQDVVGENP